MTPVAALQASWAIFRARPLMALSLGAAVVLSLASVCCGVGFATAPWFLCELLRMQLSCVRQRAVSGRGGRLSAMTVSLGAVVLVSTVGFLALLGTSVGPTDQPAAGPPALVDLAQLVHTGGFYAVLCSLGTLLLVLPYLYAPLLLLEQRGGLVGALLESARMVFGTGALSRLWLSAVAHGLQALPVLLAVGGGLVLGQADRVPLWIVVALPLLSFTVPLGQGMVVASYAQTVESARTLSTPPAGFRVPRVLGGIWSALLLAPMLVSVLVSVSLARPVALVPGRVEGVVVFDQPVTSVPATLRPPSTALALRVSPSAVSVTASDGGGAGRLPLASPNPIARLRVVRSADAYGIEVHQAGRSFHTWIDRAGVRLDDGLKLRLLSRFPRSVLWGLGLGLLVTAVVAAPVLTGLGRVRRAYQLRARSVQATEALEAIRERMFARALWGAAVVLPFTLFAVYWSVHANYG